MEKHHRELILSNSNGLINLTDYKKLMHACVIKQLLSPRMRNIIETKSLPENYGEKDKEMEFHKELLAKITRRGPTAFEKFRIILSELQYDKALQLLNKSRYEEKSFKSLGKVKKFDADSAHPIRILSNNYRNSSVGPSLELYSGEIRKRSYEVVKSQGKQSRNTVLADYPMKSRDNRGVLFLVNIIDFDVEKDRRNGAEEDTDSLLYLFKELGFKLFCYTNVLMKEFLQLLNDVLESDYTRQTECFVMVLMTHGVIEGSVEYVRFKDGILGVFDILERFRSHLCPNLTGKPKVLIFPFCRGDRPDTGVYQPVQTDGIGNQKINVPSLSDVIICYAVPHGFESHREPDSGSWYIQTFCEQMAQHAHNLDFENILKLVEGKISKMRALGTRSLQTSSYLVIGMMYGLYFNPGWYDENSS